jgi:hypothetical protein
VKNLLYSKYDKCLVLPILAAVAAKNSGVSPEVQEKQLLAVYAILGVSFEHNMTTSPENVEDIGRHIDVPKAPAARIREVPHPKMKRAVVEGNKREIVNLLHKGKPGAGLAMMHLGEIVDGFIASEGFYGPGEPGEISVQQIEKDRKRSGHLLSTGGYTTSTPLPLLSMFCL